jgi:Uma2 family endonuclease
MNTQLTDYYELIAQLPADTVITFHGVSWEEYEELLDQVGEASGLRISFDSGTLTIMTLSPEHESYTRFLESLMSVIRLRLRISIRSFGSATMRKRSKSKGNEPDACFYVQTAAALGNRLDIDFAVDPPPDIAVEIDVHHDSLSRLAIYAGLEVPEVWRYDGEELMILILQEDRYVAQESSLALPMLTGSVLSGFLTRLRTEGESPAILAFDEWLSSQESSP